MESNSLFVLIFFSITFIICIIYIVNKLYFLKKNGYEDLFFIICLLFNVTYTFSTIAETGGIGIINIHGNVSWVYCILAISYYTVLWSVRLYLIFSYKNLVKEIYKENYLNTIILFFLLSYISLNIQFITSCIYTPGFFINNTPVCREIDFGIPPTQLCLNITSDFILLFLPSRIILKSKLNTIHKINLISIFSSVLFLTIIGIIHNMYQFWGDSSKELLWSSIEVNMGIIIIALPSFYKSFIKIKKNKATNYLINENNYVSLENHELDKNLLKY